MKIPSITRRELLAGAAMAPLASGAASKPNIVFFMPETIRAENLRCYGHPLARTPNFDRLASEGTLFEQCIDQYPVCGASRCSLMTGWPAHVRGHRSLYYYLRPEEPNLFRYLRQNGYDVYWYGKNDLLAQDSFDSSVTDWASHRGRVQPRNPWPLGDPHYYSFLYGPGEGREDTAIGRICRPASG